MRGRCNSPTPRRNVGWGFLLLATLLVATTTGLGESCQLSLQSGDEPTRDYARQQPKESTSAADFSQHPR
jgi:hypothetical protein